MNSPSDDARERRYRIRPADAEPGRGPEPTVAAGAKGTNLLLTVLRNPRLYESWRPLARSLIAESSLSVRHRELIILRVGILAGSDYEWGNHVLVAREAGFTDREIAAVREGPASAVWTPLERALMQLPEQLLRTGVVSQDVLAQLHAEFSDSQLVEMVLLIGHYLGVSYLATFAGVEREDGVPGFDEPEDAP